MMQPIELGIAFPPPDFFHRLATDFVFIHTGLFTDTVRAPLSGGRAPRFAGDREEKARAVVVVRMLTLVHILPRP